MSDIEYQENGSDKIFNTLFIQGENRCLLADEAGLGKTITAAGVIAKFYDKCKSEGKLPVRIGYICANEALARENVKKIKKKLWEINNNIKIDEKYSERLSLGFLNCEDKSCELSIFTVTPSTTINISSKGTAKERAFAYCLLGEDYYLHKYNSYDKKNNKIQAFEIEYTKAYDTICCRKTFNFTDEFRRAVSDEWDKIKDNLYKKFIEEAVACYITDEQYVFPYLNAFCKKMAERAGNLNSLCNTCVRFRLGWCTGKICLPEKKLSEKILDEIIKKIEEKLINYSITFKNTEVNNKIIAGIEKKFMEICCQSYMRIARRQMIFKSIELLDMDLFIADEIQNYSEIFSHSSDTELNVLVNTLIRGNKKMLMMSATPFRYHSRLKELENKERDPDSDFDTNYSDDNARIYLENETDIFEEFKKIISYLNEDFDFEKWNKINKSKAREIKLKQQPHYNASVKIQSKMLADSGISRVERYMSGKGMSFSIENESIEWDEALYKELRNLPKSDITPISEIEDNDILIRYNNDYFICRDNRYFKTDDSCADECSVIFSESCDYDDSFNKCIIFSDDIYDELDEKETKKHIALLKSALEKDSLRRDYIKSTPAMFSFKYGYKKLENIQDKDGGNTLSSKLINNNEKLFYDGENDNGEVIYNARIKKLFEVIFDKEKQHKLLFIPPSRSNLTLEGVFKGKRGVSKRLFFTDYNMTPRSLSAILSYEAERRALEDYNSKFDKESHCITNELCSVKFGLEELKKSDNVNKIINILYEHDRKNCGNSKQRNYGSPYSYAINRKSLVSNIEKFCKAYFKYMCRYSSAIVVFAYTNCNNLYDAIIEYGKNGCIWDVFDEFSEYCNGEENECFADAFESILNIRLNAVQYIAKEGGCLNMPVGFALGHSSNDSKGSSAKALNNKIRIFNSPFRPFQFISTSIGQEGFDFHTYCRKVVHWSLECDPVKFEQREGRINRYQCYANRLSIDFSDCPGKSFKEFYDQLRGNNEDTSHGLYPDFVFEPSDENLSLVREFYYYPDSFELNQLPHVLKGVGYYRALLGQSGAEHFEDDFIEFIKGKTDIREFFINLYPYPKKSPNEIHVLNNNSHEKTEPHPLPSGRGCQRR